MRMPPNRTILVVASCLLLPLCVGLPKGTSAQLNAANLENSRPVSFRNEIRFSPALRFVVDVMILREQTKVEIEETDRALEILRARLRKIQKEQRDWKK
jgi:hypothetical protein